MLTSRPHPRAPLKWSLPEGGGLGASPSNNAEPIRTIVAPSSIATSKSPLMPMESSSRAKPGGQSFRRRSRTAQGGELAASGVQIALQPGHAHQPADLEVGVAGQLRHQRLDLGGRKAVLGRLARNVHLQQEAHACGDASPAAASSSASSRRLSTEWIRSTSGSVRRTLLRCKWPTMCQRRGKPLRAAARSQSCCGRLSPKSRNPPRPRRGSPAARRTW